MGKEVPSMVLTEVEPRIFHAHYQKHYDVSLAFCRMNEWTESPNGNFMGHPIALDDYMRWYARDLGKGVFSYPTDWDGFNVRSPSVEAILEMHSMGGRYAMSELEEELVTAVKDLSEYSTYSIIGTSRQSARGTLQHEIAHGRWYVNPVYHERMSETVESHRKDIKPMFRWLKKARYHEQVWNDEVHAYALTGWPEKGELEVSEGLVKLRADLRAVQRGLLKDGHLEKS